MKFFVLYGLALLLSGALFMSLLKINWIKTKPPVQKITTEKVVSTPLLREFNYGDRKTKQIALTFDADMTPGMAKRLKTGQVKSYFNSAVISVLEKYNVSATIFITGMWAEIYPGETKMLATNPLFEIGNHSYSHPGFKFPCYTLVYVNQANKEIEISKTQEIIEKITGIKPSLFRFPGGCHSQKDIDLVNSNGLTVVGWDVSSTDAFNKNAESIVKRVLSQAKNGSVIVFHLHGGPNAPETAVALDKIIPELTNRGFKFVKVSQMMK